MTVYSPITVGEALERLSGGAVPMAGGTDLSVRLRSSEKRPDLVLLDRIESMKWVSLRGDYLVLGACATWQRVIDSPLIAVEVPLLAMAASSVGGPALRHMGTVGGNICTASPGADGLCSLWALGAEVCIRSLDSTRSLPIDDFILGPGKTVLEPGELLTEILIPLRTGWRPFFRKDGLRRAMAISVGSCAAIWRPSEDGGSVEEIRMVLGSMGPVPIRSLRAEAAMAGASLFDEGAFRSAGDALGLEVKPIDDIRASRAYRVELARNYPTIFRSSVVAADV
ncbi:xanthine dehydrogenase family protein subunit M [Dethiosulfovibrio sp. F2B]|uniref:FAD binding domain-containing protein n=1 Tax=Dethiosulfovibrio faecalis TaxID=2720018 RepID=UPI001F190461|nr:xanthine dehydrogenase family protein subunit M [Dethiosulfovibrio faecalis]